MGWNLTEIALQMKKLSLRQALGKQIFNLFRSRYISNQHITLHHFLPDKVQVNLNVLGASMTLFK